MISAVGSIAQEFRDEMPSTRRVLERIPQDKLASVYLRLLEVPVPAVYGPTADENPFA
jgi:hypothetical protein